MIGIVSYGVSIPYHRLQKATAAQAFGKRVGSGEKAVAYCDEDSVTLAVAAAREAMINQDASILPLTTYFPNAPLRSSNQSSSPVPSTSILVR